MNAEILELKILFFSHRIINLKTIILSGNKHRIRDV